MVTVKCQIGSSIARCTNNGNGNGKFIRAARWTNLEVV
jgi:hypothetical protein